MRDDADSPSAVRRRVPVTGALVLAGVGLLFAVLVVEGALRVAGFQYHLMPTVQFGWPDPKTIRTDYVDDPDLFWVTPDYRDKLRAARRTHPALVFMGDSCTAFGTYPEHTIELLARDYHLAITGIHVAAGGWSSEQGLAQLRRDIIPLHPKIVVIYYGWNDHWMALGPTDPDLHAARRFLWLADHLRIVQVALKVKVGLAERNGERPNRVPAARYRRNLEDMAGLARHEGIQVIFVTAPSNYVPGHEPQYLLRRHVRRLADVIPLHQQYVQLTRDAAGAAGAILCDAAAAFAALPEPHDRYFRGDAIHFTADGDWQLAKTVSACIAGADR
jgi:lysophospholipase L1-like esterase